MAITAIIITMISLIGWCILGWLQAIKLGADLSMMSEKEIIQDTLHPKPRRHTKWFYLFMIGLVLGIILLIISAIK